MPIPYHLQDLINNLKCLPTIGPKTAERLAFYIVKRYKKDNIDLSNAILQAQSTVKFCQTCFNFAEQENCDICNNPKRDGSKLCIVAKPFDIVAIEKTKDFDGLYHVLGGIIQPLKGIGPEKLHIKELLMRLKNDNEFKEIIIATNPDVEGEATSLFIANLLKKHSELDITRLGIGLPMGGDLEYADEITLKQAIENRRKM